MRITGTTWRPAFTAWQTRSAGAWPAITAGALLAVLLPVSALTSAGSAALTWQVVPSPNAGTAHSDNFLQGVSCAAPGACTAVGVHSVGGRDVTLAESWQGSTWSVVPSPTPPSITAGLNGVSCPAPAACTAVGGYETGPVTGGRDKTLIESWNGARWSVVPSPNGPGKINGLDGVSCTSQTFCMAVGTQVTTANKPLAESWNGSTWSLVPIPGAGPAGGGELSGVSCTAPSACVAVGSYGASGRTLAEYWNGTAWSVMPTPNPAKTATNTLLGVSCATRSACMAVGFDEASFTEHTLIERWNGTAWSLAAHPASGNILYGVSCAAAAACTAVGSSYTGTPPTLIESWNGATWSVVKHTDLPGAIGELYSDSCPSPATCTAGGYYYRSPADIDRTLVESGTASP
jgi:hypothetical protein